MAVGDDGTKGGGALDSGGRVCGSFRGILREIREGVWYKYMGTTTARNLGDDDDGKGKKEECGGSWR